MDGASRQGIPLHLTRTSGANIPNPYSLLAHYTTWYYYLTWNILLTERSLTPSCKICARSEHTTASASSRISSCSTRPEGIISLSTLAASSSLVNRSFLPIKQILIIKANMIHVSAKILWLTMLHYRRYCTRVPYLRIVQCQYSMQILVFLGVKSHSAGTVRAHQMKERNPLLPEFLLQRKKDFETLARFSDS